MDFNLTGAEQEVADLASKLAREVLAPRAAEVDAGAFPHENLQALGGAGLLGVKIPREFGGLASSNLAYCHAIKALAGACASTAVTVAVTNMVADMIEKFGTDAQKARYLRALCTGQFTAGSFALSEAGAGSDAASLRCKADRVEGGYTLNGAKMWITSGDVAGVVLVMAKTDATVGARGISAFLVEQACRGSRSVATRKSLDCGVVPQCRWRSTTCSCPRPTAWAPKASASPSR